jgi:hypothetical protein
MGATYSIPGVNGRFTVESHSNDDFGEDRFVEAVKDRIAQSPPAEKDIFMCVLPNPKELQRLAAHSPRQAVLRLRRNPPLVVEIQMGFPR